ncbi:MAG: plasmid maintenance protein [Gammaproteobacteria bacterium RIFCSPLOWO2_02_FULL_42_14]|nr:MAG: plasmid maintenance protein [Gammaproteobacteria bacterium RIFCSPHIGHO2_02_FULL_42_43]OGT28059.1 MAG: plasmid maintenance protein [Gammaproteobacteria bacterium RIFCSPHIGHO2_01_FULL_42_8]OGT51896.1 MAG: plasmid maintenance protein [Gammaproteobacteria bacterium RIFCSPHIGHO2_12_FULL_41_25]OGT62410.1 MAG: plasmid maintenance protein [Gammaproteobacteria bacterium RIFCSPLOWO2_02_FULL_42_14]OGT85362.1 MAG: plasmid maintenance protein [Gammaproteobacteria bacterium RIFCSPLOWO2_12_FULL_42_18]
MSLKYMLDTNICIYISKKKPATVLTRFEQTLPGEIGMSIITYSELLYGAYKSQLHQQAIQKLTALTHFIPVLPLPNAVAEYYAKIRSLLEKKGEPIGGNDLLIAAHALSLGVILVTNNEKEFKRIAELKIENWC